MILECIFAKFTQMFGALFGGFKSGPGFGVREHRAAASKNICELSSQAE
jgi:hypothetical protein